MYDHGVCWVYNEHLFGQRQLKPFKHKFKRFQWILFDGCLQFIAVLNRIRRDLVEIMQK